jgi:dTDP-4-amino-4,6-dideoxygalactose transaminase
MAESAQSNISSEMVKTKVQYDYGLGDEERRAILTVLQGDKFVGHEQKRKLEKEFCDYIGAKYTVALSSGTAGIHCSLLALGVQAGDEVITVANTHSTPAMCIMNAGAKPVLVDIDEETLNIDPRKIEEKITPRTKALMPVHSNGHPYDVDPVKEVAQKHGLRVIEDAAQSLGAKYRGKRLGTFGEVGIYSFARHKHVIAGGWGGIIVTNDEEIADIVRAFASQGRDGRYEEKGEYGVPMGLSGKVGYSYWLSEVNAAIARVQFRKFRTGSLRVEERRRNAERYNELLEGIPPVQTPIEKEWAYHSYCRYVVRAKDRDRLYTYLTKKGIYVAVHYYTPTYREPYYTERFGLTNESFPFTERASKEVLTLPSWPQLTEKQLVYVTNSIKKFYQSA